MNDAPRARRAHRPLTPAQEHELRALIPTEAEIRAALLSEDDMRRSLGLVPLGPRPPSPGALRQRRYRERQKERRRLRIGDA